MALAVHNTLMADPDTDDRILLARCGTAADASAFEALVRRHLPFVYRAAARQLAPIDRHMADDVTQAVFLILLRKPKAAMAARSLPA